VSTRKIDHHRYLVSHRFADTVEKAEDMGKMVKYHGYIMYFGFAMSPHLPLTNHEIRFVNIVTGGS